MAATVGSRRLGTVSVARRRLAPARAWEPAVAIAAGAVFVAVSLVAFLGGLLDLGAATSLFAAVLVGAGLVLLVGGLYVWAAVRGRARARVVAPATPVRRAAPPRAPSPAPDDDLDAASGFVVPIDLDDEAPYLAPEPTTLRPSAARARGPGAAAEAVRRSATADEAYRSAVSPMSGSIAFAPVIQSSVRAPPAGVDAGAGVSMAHPSPSTLQGLRRNDPLVDDPPLTVPSRPPRPPISPARSGGAATIAQIPQPPDRPSAVATSSRHCTSCDSTIPGDLNVPLCWGCGRVLCSSCYWRNGPGPGLHRCPECTARASSQSTPSTTSVPLAGGARTGSTTAGSTFGPPKGGRSSP
ncbi:MAG: hypothetical protein L3K23_07875 [Thermoplasmata archaeon]|nr:hypothetical protein [Thermoplasmata archaeon]